MKLLQLLENMTSQFPTSKEEVEIVLKKHNIENYKINGDLSVDVDGDVVLFNDKKLVSIPVNFGKVSGRFNCYNSRLTSLKGAPREVGGDFWCAGNKLTSLKGAPLEVGGNFSCYSNELTSLQGAPREIVGNFDCSHNQLTSLQGAPREVGGHFDALKNPNLKSLDGIGTVYGGILTDLK
jgi:hypothetical protein